MVYGDHIAITSGDKSTTRREVSVAGCPCALWIYATHRDFLWYLPSHRARSGKTARASRAPGWWTWPQMR